MPWEDPELATDEAGIIERILLGMADRMPGWTPVEGAPEVALAEEIGRETAATNALAIESLQLAIAGIGETVFGLAPRVGAAAVLPDVQLNLRDPDAASDADTTKEKTVTIPAGFTIIAGDVAFTTLVDIVEPLTYELIEGAGDSFLYVATLHIEMTAATVGTAGNVPAGTAATVVTNTGQVASVTIVEDGDGGVDEETLADYLDRVTDYLSVLRPGAVRADSLAALARTVSGVHRAIGFDLYDPAIPGTPQQRTATVVAIDATGEYVTGSTLTELQATLNAAREVNFNVILHAPTYTGISVAATVVAATGVDHTDLQTRVSAALIAKISPASWGSTGAAPESWDETTTVRALDLAIVASQVAGVASVTAVTVNGGATATLAGKGALPATVSGAPGHSTMAVTVS